MLDGPEIRPLLHVGYIKTGTSWLQRHLFNNKAFGFLLAEPDSRALLIEYLVCKDPFQYDLTRESSVLRHAENRVTNKGAIPVWSDETLLGDPLCRRYDGAQIALRLYKLFPRARVLITIREQRSAAYSIYREYVRSGGAHGFKGFFGTGAEDLSFSPVLRPHYLAYHCAIKFYQRLWGMENILVLPLELLKKDPEQYVERLVRFCGLATMPLSGKSSFDVASLDIGPVNIGVRGMTTVLCRPINRFLLKDPLKSRQSVLFRLIYKIGKMVNRVCPDFIHQGIERRHMKWINKRYGKIFAADNKELGKLAGLDLKAFGYAVSGD